MMATETVQIELYTRFKNLVSINKTNKKKKKRKEDSLRDGFTKNMDNYKYIWVSKQIIMMHYFLWCVMMQNIE